MGLIRADLEMLERGADLEQYFFECSRLLYISNIANRENINLEKKKINKR